MKQIIRWKPAKLLQITNELSELDSHDFEELFNIIKETSSRIIKL